MRAACSNITGVSIGEKIDRSTWGINYTGAASGSCKTAADAAFWPSCGPSGTVKSMNADTSAKTLVSSAINPAERTAVILSVGQSLSGNFSGTAYTPVSSKVQNWNIYDRQIYLAVDPLLGCEGPGTAGLGSGNWLSRMADKLIAAGTFDRVILVPIAVGGTTVADWAPGGKYNDRLKATVAAVQDNLGIPITFIHWGQGEQDGVAGTTQSAWQTSFGQMVASIRAAGSSAPIFVTRETYELGAASATIRAAQAAVVDNVTIFAGADTDPPVIPDAERQDQTHLNATGADHRATLEQTIISAHYH